MLAVTSTSVTTPSHPYTSHIPKHIMLQILATVKSRTEELNLSKEEIFQELEQAVHLYENSLYVIKGSKKKTNNLKLLPKANLKIVS